MAFTTLKPLYILIWPLFSVAADKLVLTNTGLVRGMTVSKGGLCIEAFLGIPYAESPTGELRFRRPLPKMPWYGVYNAHSLPPSCMQNNSGNYYEPSSDTPMSEDCLFLNLWVPYHAYFTSMSLFLKPIIVFIYGGAFNIGSSNMKLYDGANLARKGEVIVATLNYRVGAFGFLFADIEEANGNMGLFDQIAAIEWIKTNARAFGGDPDHIVLLGESAGAMAIGGHLSSPVARNLFKRAIMQSGAATMPLTLENNTGIFRMSQRLASFTGCAEGGSSSLRDKPHQVVACMRNISAKSLADAEGHIKRTYPITFFPRIGDDFMPEPSIHFLKRGVFGDGELLIGTVEAEGPFFLSVAAEDYFGKHGTNKIQIPSKRFARNFLRTVLKAARVGPEEKGISSSYVDPIENGTSDAYLDTISNAVGDYFITCSVYFHAELFSLKNPVYYYVMKRRPSSTPLAEWMKMTHFDEMQYVFGNPLFGNFTPEEEAFSNKVMGRWLAFAKTGNPNLPGEVEWPRFHLNDQKYMELADVDVLRSGRPEEGRCEVWRRTHNADIDDDVLEAFRKRSQESHNFPWRMYAWLHRCIESFLNGQRRWYKQWIRTFHFN